MKKPLGVQQQQTAQVREADLRARWFRIRLEVDPRPNVSPAAPQANSDPVFLVPNRTELGPGFPVKVYAPVGRCIYCDATEFIPGTGRKLSEEHIVSEGLGGVIVLPEASCEVCAKTTTKIEGNILRTVLWTPRRHLKIRGKKRKRDERTFPLTAVVDGKDVPLHLPLNEHPALLFLLRLQAPGILLGRPEEFSGIAGIWMQELISDSINEMRDRGLPSFASPSIDTVRFCQMLAKIAHGFAVAELGLDGFKPLLLEQLILRELAPKENWCGCYRLVGGDTRDYAPDDALHVMGWGVDQRGDKHFLVVAVRLFANLGAPVFHVIAGELDQAQLERALALAKPREQPPDRTPVEPQ